MRGPPALAPHASQPILHGEQATRAARRGPSDVSTFDRAVQERPLLHRPDWVGLANLGHRDDLDPVLGREELDRLPEVGLAISEVGADTDESCGHSCCYVRCLEAPRGRSRRRGPRAFRGAGVGLGVRAFARSGPRASSVRLWARARSARSRACAAEGGRREAGERPADLAGAKPPGAPRSSRADPIEPRLRRRGRPAAAADGHAPPPAEGTDWWIANVGANGAASPGAGKPLTIIDTGVDLTHEEFASRPATTALNPQSTTGHLEEHGTAVASVAAAPLNNVGVLGAYPQANLYAWDASPSGAGITAGDVIQGLDAAMHLGAASSTSASGRQIRNPLLDTMIARVQAAGVLVVAAAGNSRQRAARGRYPASLPHVVTVGAIDSGSQPTYFTSGSPYVDLAAPGEIIYVAVPKTLHPPPSYDFFDGTSFASPIVAAAADWVWTVRPTWTGRRSRRCSARRRRTSTPRGSTRSPASAARTSPPR